MVLLPIFPARSKPGRRGVSELYASVLMIGVTLSVGSFVAVSALNQFSLAAGSASLGASLQQSSAGVQLGLSYAAVAPSGSCPVYEGDVEGTALTVALYNFGASAFTPTEFMVNSTAYPGSYAAASPGSLSLYSVTLSGCAHGSGLTIAAADPAGDEVQFGS